MYVINFLQASSILLITHSFPDIRFHPDGRQIALTGGVGEGKIEVWVIENFLPESTANK